MTDVTKCYWTELNECRHLLFYWEQDQKKSAWQIKKLFSCLTDFFFFSCIKSIIWFGASVCMHVCVSVHACACMCEGVYVCVNVCTFMYMYFFQFMQSQGYASKCTNLWLCKLKEKNLFVTVKNLDCKVKIDSQNNVHKSFAEILSVFLGLLERIELAILLRCTFNRLQTRGLLPLDRVPWSKQQQALCD